jgi:hypothetical protein
VGWGQRVGAREVPHQVATHTPRVQGGAIWSFGVVPVQTSRLQFCLHIRCPQGTHDNVIRLCMASQTPSAFPAREAMVPESPDLNPTNASMAAHEWGAEAETGSDSEFPIAQGQAKVPHWEDIEPGPCVRG